MSDTSITSFCNAVLSKIGEARITSLDDYTKSAEMCRLWFPITRRAILTAAPWNGCEASADLTLIEGAEDPRFSFVYAAPSDMLYPRYLVNYGYFRLGVHDKNTRVILSDTANAKLIYSFDQDNLGMWGSDLYQAMISAMAANITYPITGKASLASFYAEQANAQIMSARVNNANNNNIVYDDGISDVYGEINKLKNSNFVYRPTTFTAGRG